jgi:hypothetical protein
MVGGFAINLHGYQRFTGDLNIWIKDTLQNRQQLRKTFISCNMGDYPMIENMQFVPGWADFQLNNSLKLDILIDMKGLLKAIHLTNASRWPSSLKSKMYRYPFYTSIN